MNHSEIYEHPSKKHHEWCIMPITKKTLGMYETNHGATPTAMGSWKMDGLNMYFLLKMGIFHCNVRFAEGQNCTQLIQDSSARLRWCAAKIDTCGIHLCWGLSVIHGKQNHPAPPFVASKKDGRALNCETLFFVSKLPVVWFLQEEYCRL